MRVSILIVTFRRDWEFCKYALMSIAKYASGFYETIVLVPEEDRELFGALHGQFNFKLRTMDEPKGKGMLNHEWAICCGEKFCPQADLILHFDADYIFTAPVMPETYLRDGKPILICNPYENVKEANHRRWQKVAQNAVGFAVTHDFMCRQPIIHDCRVYPKVRSHVEEHTGVPFRDFVLSGQNEFPQSFAEFPTIGAIASTFFPEYYAIVDLSKEPEPRNPVMRGWSHGGMDFEMEFQDGTRTTARKKFAEFL